MSDLRQFETFVGNPASTLSNAKSPTPATGHLERYRTLFTSGRCVATWYLEWRTEAAGTSTAAVAKQQHGIPMRTHVQLL
jgi:hypothetical protein